MYNKVIYNDETIMDLTYDTIEPSAMLNGRTAHDSSGKPIIGSIPIMSNEDYRYGQAEIESLEESEPPTIASCHKSVAHSFTTTTVEEDVLAIIPETGYYDQNSAVIIPSIAVVDEPRHNETHVIVAEPYEGVLREVTVKPIPERFIDTSDATATPIKLLEGQTAYVDGKKVVGTMPDRTELDPNIGGISSEYPNVSVWMGGFLQFKEPLVSGVRCLCLAPKQGYYSNGASYIGYKARTVIVSPTATQQDVWTTPTDGVLEHVVVNGTSNLVAPNIKKGATVGGVEGTYTSDANAAAADIISGKTAYVNGVKVTGSLPNYTNPWPKTVTVSWDTTNKYCSFYFPCGAYRASTNSAIYPNHFCPQAPYEDKTITPSSSVQTATPSSGKVLRQVTVNAVSNLSAANIKSGVTVGGVAGTFTSDATTNAASILKNKTAYAKGSKLTGTMPNWTGVPDHITDMRLKDNQFQVAVHAGYHHYNWASNSYEYMTYAEVANLIGLTANKLVSGQRVLGVNGTAAKVTMFNKNTIIKSDSRGRLTLTFDTIYNMVYVVFMFPDNGAAMAYELLIAKNSGTINKNIYVSSKSHIYITPRFIKNSGKVILNEGDCVFYDAAVATIITNIQASLWMGISGSTPT